jgi:hypothetical protein
MVCPKLPKGKSITMAARLKSSKRAAAGSGVMYNVHVRVYKIFKYMYISQKIEFFEYKFDFDFSINFIIGKSGF